jgi:hypothetical protein
MTEFQLTTIRTTNNNSCSCPLNFEGFANENLNRHSYESVVDFSFSLYTICSKLQRGFQRQFIYEWADKKLLLKADIMSGILMNRDRVCC